MSIIGAISTEFDTIYLHLYLKCPLYPEHDHMIVRESSSDMGG